MILACWPMEDTNCTVAFGFISLGKLVSWIRHRRYTVRCGRVSTRQLDNGFSNGMSSSNLGEFIYLLVLENFIIQLV